MLLLYHDIMLFLAAICNTIFMARRAIPYDCFPTGSNYIYIQPSTYASCVVYVVKEVT